MSWRIGFQRKSARKDYEETPDTDALTVQATAPEPPKSFGATRANILALASLGMKNADLAKACGAPNKPMSDSSVKNHLSEAAKALGLTNQRGARTNLWAAALAAGLANASAMGDAIARARTNGVEVTVPAEQ